MLYACKQIGGPVISKLARRSRIAVIGVVAVAALGLTACTGQNTAGGAGDVNTVDKGLSSSLEQAVQQAMKQSGSTEAVVGVWTGGKKGDYVQAFGSKNLSADAAIRGGQTTQPALCALLLSLNADGTIKLGREVSKDLPRQKGLAGITYEQLCNGTSGLADFKTGISDIFANNPLRPWSDRELLANGLVRSPLLWPGQNVYISDTDSLVLARAIEEVTNQPIADLLKERVYSKASMGSTYLPDPTTLTLPAGGMTGLTYPAAGGKPVCEAKPAELSKISTTMLSAAGASVTTVSDLKNFYSAYFGGTFGTKKDQELITKTQSTANPKRDKDGKPVNDAPADPNGQQFGFGVEKTGPLYGRSGAITGAITAAYQDPSSGFTVVVTLNNSSAGSGFARALAFQLAALAKDAGAGPDVPWTAADKAKTLTAGAVCQ